MAFEIIKHLQATPNRVYDALKSIEAVGEVEEQIMFELWQPKFISKGQQAIRPIIDIFVTFGLVESTIDGNKYFLIDNSFLASYASFRSKMQEVMLGATQEHENNYLLSQVTAWYAARNDEVITMERTDFERLFHQDLYPTTTRVISERDSIFAWGLWAQFLGFGKEFNPEIVSGRRLMPNAKVRILPILRKILRPGETVTVDQFIEMLGAQCPELDGGLMYQQCFETVHDASVQNATLSLMLSTALRQLHVEGVVTILNEPDAVRTRQLFPAQSFENQISHLKLYRNEEIA